MLKHKKKVLSSAFIASTGAAAGMASSFQCAGAGCSSCFRCLGIAIAVGLAYIYGCVYAKRKEDRNMGEK